MADFDPGPPQPFHDLFDHVPDYGPVRQHFWYDWGPVFYRGRLDGTARVLCIASDPGPTERIAGRTLVGDAGQRVQGFLTKLGLTRSYVCLNAFSYALFPSHGGRPARRSSATTTRRPGGTRCSTRSKTRTRRPWSRSGRSPSRQSSCGPDEPA